jgi:hypothetical protein
MAGYSYLPIFGVEPFKNVKNVPVTTFNGVSGDYITTFGGGADVTGDNLLITLWGNLESYSGPLVAPLGGDLLQPDYAMIEGAGVTDILPGLLNKGFLPFAKSRTSFKITFLQSDGEGAFVTLPLMGIMNPPGELKNAYKYAAKAAQAALTVNNPTGVLINFKKSTLDALMWRAAFCGSSGSLDQITALSGFFASGNLFVSPLAKTSGADGNFPEFYPNVFGLLLAGDLAGANAYFDEIAKGNFYIPTYFEPVVDPGNENFWLAEITWPHSVPR